MGMKTFTIGQTLFPDHPMNQADNDGIAYKLLVLITLMSLWRSVAHMLIFDGGAGSIATIPLDQYSEPAAAAVIAIFAQWGLSQLLLAFFQVTVVVKYRGFVPLSYLLLTLEYTGRICVGTMKPLTTITKPPGAYLNFVLAPLAAYVLVGLLYNNNNRAVNNKKECR